MPKKTKKNKKDSQVKREYLYWLQKIKKSKRRSPLSAD